MEAAADDDVMAVERRNGGKKQQKNGSSISCFLERLLLLTGAVNLPIEHREIFLPTGNESRNS